MLHRRNLGKRVFQFCTDVTGELGCISVAQVKLGHQGVSMLHRRDRRTRIHQCYVGITGALGCFITGALGCFNVAQA